MHLGRASRALLAAGAFTSFASAFVATPRSAGSTVWPVRNVRDATPSPLTTAIAVVLPRRDPFAGEPPKRAAPPPPALGAPPPIPGAAIAARLGPLPPNAGAPPPPFGTAPAARVTAVVTGDQPFAIVEENGAVRIVARGDRIAGDAIVAITADGVRLAHGRAVAVESRSATAAHPPEDSPR